MECMRPRMTSAGGYGRGRRGPGVPSMETMRTLPEPRTSGLSTEEARRRLAESGPNAIAEAEGPSPVREFLANFVQLFALLLWAGAVLALVGRDARARRRRSWS